MHEYPPQYQHRVALARAGQVHGVFGHVPGPAPAGGFALVTLGDIVDAGRLLHAEPGQLRGRDVDLGRRRDEGHPASVHGGQVRIRDQLGVPDDQQPALGGHLLQGLHHRNDLADLACAAVEGPVEHRDAAVPADRDPGLDLLQVRAPVLGMTELRSGKPFLAVLVLTVHRDRGHVPVQPGHIDPERLDRRHPDRPGDLVQMRGDRIQRPPDPVIIEQPGLHPERLTHRPVPRPRLDMHQRRRRRQPVGHQRLDHLTMGKFRQVTHRAHAINDVTDLQPRTETSHHRQRPQQLLHRPRTELRILSHSPAGCRPPDPRSTRRTAQPPKIHMCGKRA